MKFDLTTYSFENHQHRLLITASAGKGAARGREEDSLIIKLWPSDMVSLSVYLLAYVPISLPIYLSTD